MMFSRGDDLLPRTGKTRQWEEMDWTQRLPEISRNSRLARAAWMLVAVLISWLHLFVHTVGIRSSDLPLDDASTWGVARQGLGRLFTLPTEFHSQPPLYYFILHFLLPINSSPWFLRGISWFFCWMLILFVLFYWHEVSLWARVCFSLLFIFSSLTDYLSTAVRPYGLASFLTFVASIMLLRLLSDPSFRRGRNYFLWATPMLYTMAFEVAVLMVHGLVVVAAAIAALLRLPRPEALRRCKIGGLTMGALVLVYLPYLLLAYHYQYKPNPVASLNRILLVKTYADILQAMLGFAPSLFLGLIALACLGIVAKFRQGDGRVLLWPLMIVIPIAFVCYFIIGRSPIGAQHKYMLPALLAFCALIALGLEQFRPQREFWLVLIVWLAIVIDAHFQPFHRSMTDQPEIGQFTILHRELMTFPGKKLIFFNVGYDGQHLEYVTRNDPNVLYGTMRGSHWASGGDNHLDDDYIVRTVEKNRQDCRCFFYHHPTANGPYARAFVPTMERNGYRPTCSLPAVWGQRVVGYCRD